ncbi:MAG: type II secretion system protein [Solirubrobacterales bacterium]
MRDESGFTIVELLVSILASMAILSAIVMITTVATHNQDRIARRVVANERARPLMTRVVQELHAACIAPGIVPIIGDGTANGSSATRISFLSKSGSDVSPVPDKHVITLTGTTLSEYVYPGTSSQAPWNFSGTASSSSKPQLLTDVSAPSGTVFSYYGFVNGQLSTTPFPASPGLSATDAAHTAIVRIGLTISPNGGASRLDQRSPITLEDSVDLRLENAGQYPNQDNLPCV